MKYSDFCKKIYPHKNRLITTQAWFVQQMFLSAGSNYFHSRPDSTDSYEKKLFQGKPITEPIAESFTTVNIDKLTQFFVKHLKKNDLQHLFEKFDFPSNVEQDFEYFCGALAHQFALFIKKAPDAVDDIVFAEYNKQIENPARAIVLTKTLTKTDDFKNVFIPVEHDEELSTLNHSKLQLFHLNHQNSRFSFSSMESFLVENIVSYVQDRISIERYNVERDISTVAKTLNALNNASCDSWLNNELGNIIIYTFLEEVLGAPKLYNKVELISTGHGEVAYSGGGVHLYNAGSKDDPNYQLVFAKANIDDDIKSAIDNAFEEIKNVINNTNKELHLIENVILSTQFPEHTAKSLANILRPKKANHAQADNAFGVFLGYSLQLNGVPNARFRELLTCKMQADIKSHTDYILDKIKEENLDNYSFYFYFLPFNNANIEKEAVLKNILQGGS